MENPDQQIIHGFEVEIEKPNLYEHMGRMMLTNTINKLHEFINLGVIEKEDVVDALRKAGL